MQLSPEVFAACERLMRGGSHSFFAASRFLPKRFRFAATAVYAFCRVADDAVDEMPEGASIDIVMAYLHERLEAIYRQEPFAIDADIAFAAVVNAYSIPKELPVALLEGFQWDAGGRGYDTIESLHEYAARVAGTVGAMMTLIMGGRSTQTVARACELGVAMQLTNIARDVGEDARRGRLYLPLAWCREAGLDTEEFLENPQPSEAVMVVIKRVLKVAEQLYVRAETGIAALPRDCRAAIMAARLIYADIGRVILARGCNAITQRAVVSNQRKWWLMARAMGSYLIAPQRDYLLTPLSEIQFLVTAVPSPEHDPARVDAFYPVVAMLERIGQLERDQRASSPRA